MQILVCEVDSIALRLFCVELELLGHSVDVAYDTDSAMALALREMYGCVVIDIESPLSGGSTLVEALRQHRKTKDWLILLVFDGADDGSIFHGYHGGADVCMQRPLIASELETFCARR